MREHKRLPYNGTDQDLYLSVFYPAYRRKPLETALPAIVQKYNPGIKTAGDYVALVNKRNLTAELTDKEWTALKSLGTKLNMSWQPLFKLITMESAWDPKARNPSSGARGLIQFMPSTAEGMGYRAGMSMFTLLLLAAGGYFATKKLKLL
jgi:soluble lytic murein transglycosylase-like protein